MRPLYKLTLLRIFATRLAGKLHQNPAATIEAAGGSVPSAARSDGSPRANPPSRPAPHPAVLV